MTENFEILIRSLLLRPDQPAVIVLGHFSPQIYEAHGFAGPDHWHNIVAQFYDVPHISIRPAIFPDYIRDTASIKKYFTDPILANPAGHDLLADMLIAYIQSQICTAWSIAQGAAFDTPSHSGGGSGDGPDLFGGLRGRPGVPEPRKEGQNIDNNQKPDGKDVHRAHLSVPPSRINTKPNADRPFVELSPFCVSANDLVNPLPPSLFYGSGWAAHHPTGSEARWKTHYWFSSLPTSKLRIPIKVGAGDIGIYYLREPVSQVGEGSSVECWVDDNYAGAKVVENAASVGEPTAT
jgi:hypothetical protein